MDGKWEPHGVPKHAYESEWINVDLVDVTKPDGEEIEYHVVRPSHPDAACVLAYDPDKGVLLIWRHRFVNDEWGWELPAGMVEANEKPEAGAARELQEETGWKPGKLTKLLDYTPYSGSVEAKFHCFFSEGAEWVGPGRDLNEAADVAWVSLDQLREFIAKGEMREGMSLTASLFAFQFGPLKDK